MKQLNSYSLSYRHKVLGAEISSITAGSPTESISGELWEKAIIVTSRVRRFSGRMAVIGLSSITNKRSGQQSIEFAPAELDPRSLADFRENPFKLHHPDIGGKEQKLPFRLALGVDQPSGILETDLDVWTVQAEHTFHVIQHGIHKYSENAYLLSAQAEPAPSLNTHSSN